MVFTHVWFEPKIALSNEFFVFFVQADIWSLFVIFILNYVPTIKRYDIVRFTFSNHFCILSIKRLVFRQFFSIGKLLSDCLNKNIITKDVSIHYLKVRNNWSCLKRRSIFPIQKWQIMTDSDWIIKIASLLTSYTGSDGKLS